MNPARIAGHAAGSVVFSAVWVTGVTLPAEPTDWRLLAVSVLPQVVAAISLVMQHHAEAVTAPSSQTRPSPQPRRALPSRTSEVTR